jgi:thiamine biosynthesis lipoprotein
VALLNDNKTISLSNTALTEGLFRLSFKALGTACEISFSAESSSQAEAFRKRSLSWVRNFETRYSRYLPESLISQINQNAGIGKVVSINEEDLRLFKLCDTLHFFTEGLFDPTTLPLSLLWDFKAKKPQIPDQQKIDYAISKINWKKVVFKDQLVSLPEVGMGIDFGGFGKEFAVDRVIEIAQEHNIEDIIVNFGGDLRTLGSPPDSDHWVVGIENPNQPGQARFTLLANNLAVATSGNYQRFFELGGKRYGHLLDHRTGYPTPSSNLSATVIANSCLEAGILATCSLLDDRYQGLSMIDRYFSAEGCVWSANGIAWSKKFETYLQYNR